MLKALFTFCFIFLYWISTAQISAVTEYGDQILLMDDGTWKYLEENIIIKDELHLNPKEFSKPENAEFLLKSKVFNVGIWLNPKEWKFNKPIDEDDGEYEFNLKGEDLYGKLIAEKIEIPLENLREIILQNAKNVAPDTKIVNQEYRIVNGKKVMMVEMNGTLNGINFSYKGYYYSNFNGTVQIILYTSKNLIEHYDDKIATFLNGFVELD
jgi:hypothetical protein